MRAWIRAWRQRRLLSELNVYVRAYLTAAGREDWELAARFEESYHQCLRRLRRLSGIRQGGLIEAEAVE